MYIFPRGIFACPTIAAVKKINRSQIDLNPAPRSAQKVIQPFLQNALNKAIFTQVLSSCLIYRYAKDRLSVP